MPPRSLAFLAFCAIAIGWVIWAAQLPPAGQPERLRGQRLAGWDFTQFYIIARLPLRSLYDRAAFVDFGERELAPLGVRWYPPYVRPAVFAVPFKLLRWLPYWRAFCLWAAFNFLAYGAALFLLSWRFRLPWTLFPAFALFQPAVVAMMVGQDTPLSLLALVAALLLLLDGRDVAAGLLLAAGAYKFHLLVFVPVALLFKGRHRALVAFILASVAEAIASLLIASPRAYFAMLRANEAYQAQAIGIPFFPANLRGVLSIVNAGSWYYPVALIASLGCCWLIWKLPLLEGTAVGIAAALLLAPHVCMYDLILLAIPLAVSWQRMTPLSRAAMLGALAALAYPSYFAKNVPAAWLAAELLGIAICAAGAWQKRSDVGPPVTRAEVST